MEIRAAHFVTAAILAAATYLLLRREPKKPARNARRRWNIITCRMERAANES